MTDNGRRCGTCRFWNAGDGHPDSQPMCRRYPPARIDGNRRWPEARDVDWCGEWKGAVAQEREAAFRFADVSTGKVTHCVGGAVSILAPDEAKTEGKE